MLESRGLAGTGKVSYLPIVYFKPERSVEPGTGFDGRRQDWAGEVFYFQIATMDGTALDRHSEEWRALARKVGEMRGLECMA